MGCAESHEVHHHHHHDYQRLDQSRTSPDIAPRPASLEYIPSATSVSYRMGQQASPIPPPSVSGGSSSSAIASQHERLILELLPFKDAQQFREWLGGQYVRWSWDEFCRDFLLRNPAAPEPDKNKTTEAAKSVINSKNSKYMTYHPQKGNWTSEDHHIRFIVTVVADNMLNNLWSESEWKKQNIQITKAVHEVLSLLRGTAAGTEQLPPRYED